MKNRKKVLFICNDANKICLLKLILEKSGYDFFSENAGNKVLEASLRIKPDLVILDILIPGADMCVTARELKSSREMYWTPLVALAAYETAGAREQALQCGFSAYVEEPIDPAKFCGDINALIK
jgi:CheY-like chemotaxis protein